MQRLIYIFILQLFILQTFGQGDVNFHPPLKIPMYLSGNFGEIRSDHFHSGIDIKTQGTTGHHVFSIEDGYVSRIKIQANGYGKSVYVAHNNGYTSVYGHLSDYRDDIAAYVKQIQYERRSHAVDIYLEPGKFLCKKGGFLAYSGNTGGSSGPHLHFEVRTTGNQHPTNVLKYGFNIADHSPPRFISLFVYPVDNGGYVNGGREIVKTAVVPEKGQFAIPYGTVISSSGPIGMSVEVFDYLDGASNRCGVHTLKLFVDEELRYHHVMDEFSFPETRYINAHILYSERISTGVKAHRLHRLPNDKLRIYRHINGDGILDVDQNRAYNIRVVATDVEGNHSELKFQIKGVPETEVVTANNEEYTKLMKHDRANSFENRDLKVELPAGTLYQDLEFVYAESPPANGSLSKFYHIHSQETPVHNPYTLSIKAEGIDKAYRGKLLLIATADEDEGEISPAGGEYLDEYVVASLRGFGNYAIALDTVAPEISLNNGSATGDLSGKKSLKFTIKDDISGIQKYEGYIDNSWALFEYDPKNDLLTYTFDIERISRDKVHELELYVSDEKGNVNLYHTTFTW